MVKDDACGGPPPAHTPAHSTHKGCAPHAQRESALPHRWTRFKAARPCASMRPGLTVATSYFAAVFLGISATKLNKPLPACRGMLCQGETTSVLWLKKTR